jgi:hypothetical protein
LTVGENFSEDYANTFLFESTVWDFKLIFGQLEQTFGAGNDWHTSITMPWGVAKLISHFLHAQIVAYEMNNGRIQIPLAAMPPEPVEPTGEKDTPGNRMFYNLAVQMHRHLASSPQKPEGAPEAGGSTEPGPTE